MSEPLLQEFWEACGGVRELRFLVAHGSRPTRGVVVSTPFAVVGSSDAAEIHLPDAQISYRHAYLQVISDRLWRFDLLSRTGAFWKQRRECAGLFDNTDALCVGPYQLQNLGREDAAAAASPLLAMPPEQDSLPTCTLEPLKPAQGTGSHGQFTWQLDRVLTYAGHAPLCNVRLSCPGVSHMHCSLLRTPMGVWVIDLIGRGGIAVNGLPTRWTRLRDGDCLRIGRFDMRVHAQQRRASAPSQDAVPTQDMLRLTGDAPLAAAADQRAPSPCSESAAAALGAPLARLANSEDLATLGWPGNDHPLSPACVPQGLATTDASQPLVVALVNQFSLMQQQMFDQFQQTTLMMLQMFGTLQKEQFDLIRQELHGLRDLNREIHALETELAKHRASPAEAAHAHPSSSTPASVATGPTAPRLTAPSRPRVARTSADSARAGAIEASADQVLETKKTVQDVKSNPVQVNQGSKASAPTPVRASNSPPEPAAKSNDDGAAPPSEDVHAWLSQRFSELQKERQSRWQRIVGTLTGK